jgi:hypothetical protein
LRACDADGDDRREQDDLVDWKERYRTTYHFRKGIFLGDRKKNEITIRLDTAHFVAEDPALTLSGEVMIRTHARMHAHRSV